MYLGTRFKNLNFGSVKDSEREEITLDKWNPRKVGMGVAHIHDIKWELDSNGLPSLCGGQVDLYVDMFKTLNVKIWTHHSVLMEKLGMWERFNKFKLRVVDEDGQPAENVDIKKEKEIWFGFTRRAPGPRDRKTKMFEWCSISCTLNSWIWDNFFTDNFNFVSGATWRRDAAPEVVSKAGRKRTDKKESELINIIPPHLWHLIHPELYKLTPGDASNFPSWNYNRISEKDRGAKAMKSLVLKSARGSMIYEVDVGFRGLGLSKNGFELFCEVLMELMEEEKMKEGDTFQLRILKLWWNNLKDVHLETLFKLVKICPKLEILFLCGNEFTRKGCWNIVRWCRDYKVEILLFGNEGWSIGLHKYQKRLAFAPWMRETNEMFQQINWFCVILMKYPGYAVNEALMLSDLKELFGYPTLRDAKYQYDLICPVDTDFFGELRQIWNVEKAVRPDVMKLVIEANRQLTQIRQKFLSNPNISSTLKQACATGFNDVVLKNPEILKLIVGSVDANTVKIFQDLLTNKDVPQFVIKELDDLLGAFGMNVADLLGLMVGNDELKID